MTSANLLIVLFVGTIVGALTGGLVGSSMSGLYVALLAGFVATIVAGLVRNAIMTGSAISQTPALVIGYGAVASLAASSAGNEVARLSGLESSVWIGTLAGLFSVIIMAMLIITYHTAPGEQPGLRSFG